MADPRAAESPPSRGTPAEDTGRGEVPLLRGGLVGIGLVTAATVALAAAGALIALVVALIY